MPKIAKIRDGIVCKKETKISTKFETRMEVTDSDKHFGVKLIMAVKRFIIQAPGSCTI
jgi:hypothetical protein